MNYLSTRQVSEIWGISPRRIVLLASQGRIDGAEQIDGRWFIPEDAEKPGDPRKKKTASSKRSGDPYIYPFLLGCVNSEEQVKAFTDEQKELYELCLVYETGDFGKSRVLAEKLLNAKNEYVRLGALYHLPTICMYLGDYSATEKYTILFRAACRVCRDHKAEIGVLLASFDSEMESISAYAESINTIDIAVLPDSLLPVLSVWLMFSAVVKTAKGEASPDFISHEITCRTIEAQGYYFYAMYTHLCLSMLYSAYSITEKERLHMKQAIEIALEHNVLFTLSLSVGYHLDTARDFLKKYPPEVTERILALTETFKNARNGYAEYKGNKTILAKLREDDYTLITLCLTNCTIEEIAARFGLSRSGINKRLANLYDKLGVKSKNELTKVFLHSFLDWGDKR